MSSDADNSNLLTQAIAEYMRRVDAGEAVDREQFLQANAQAGDELRQYLDNVALVEQMAGPTPAEQSQPPVQDGARRETVATSQGGDSVPEKRATVADGQITGRFGRYKIEKTLGEGAMGTVFLARDTQLDRQVALKVPKFKDDDTEMMERFYREARSAARLRHRHICPVHDIGEIDGIKYISIGYVDGHPLSSFVSAENPPAERNVAIIVRKLALALDVAHRDGIIHRDLKPANVMVDRKSEPVIMDFGLARQINKQENERLTQTGTIMGSPAYMSPEQVHADIEKIGPRSDIYSLGVMLYELLTGHLPFEGSIAAVIGQILMKEPKRPSSLRPDLDPRLEAICEKMMAKEIDKRYASMKEVADALTAFLKNEGVPGAQRSVGKLESFAPVELKEVEKQPNESRRTVASEQQTPQSADTFNTRDKASDGRPLTDSIDPTSTSNHNRRIPGWAMGLGGTVVALLVVWAVTLIFHVGDVTVRVEIADAIRNDPELKVFIDKRDISQLRVEGIGETIELAVGPHEWVVKRGDTIVQSPRKFSVTGDGQEVVSISIETIQVAKPKEQVEEPKKVEVTGDEYLSTKTVPPTTTPPPDQSGSTDPPGNRQSASRVTTINSLPDGQPGEVLAYRGHNSKTFRARFSPDGRWVYSVGTDDDQRPVIHIWNPVTGELKASCRGTLAAWSRDSKSIILRDDRGGEGVMWVRSLDDFDNPTRIAPTDHYIFSIAPSDDGQLVVTGNWTQPYSKAKVVPATVSVWNLQTGKKIHSMLGHKARIDTVAISPDGTRAYSYSPGFGSKDGPMLRVWNTSTGKEEQFFRMSSPGQFAVFSQDASCLLTHMYRKSELILVDTATGQEIKRWDSGQGRLSATARALSADGSFALSAGEAHTVRLWETASGKLLHKFEGHSDTVFWLDFSSDLRFALSSSYDGTVRIWRLPKLSKPVPRNEYSPPVVATLSGHQSSIRGVEFTTDAQHLVSVDSGGAVRQWNGQTGGVTSQYAAGTCFGMAVSPDGKVLATTHREPNLIKLWSLAEQRQLGVLKTNRPGSMLTTAVAFSPDGTTVAAVSYDNFARIWDLKTGVQRHQFLARDPKEEHGASGAGVVYTPDSRFVLVRRAATKLPRVFAFDLKRRQVDAARSFKTEHGTYGQLAISPDGKQLALTNYAGPTEFFKLGEEGEPVGISMSGGQFVCGYSPDGKAIAIGSTGRVVLFDAETHEQIAELEMPNKDARVTSIDYSPDGEYLVAGESDGKDVPRPSEYKIRIWRLNRDTDATTASSQPPVNQWVDIIPDIDVKRDALASEWSKSGGELRLLSGVQENYLRLPAELSESYEIEMAFTRHVVPREHGVALLLPFGNHHARATFSGWNTQHISGLSVVNGIYAGDAKSPCRSVAFKIVAGQRHDIRIRVVVENGQTKFSATADGKPLLAWEGPVTQLDHPTPLPDRKALLSCFDNGKTTFHGIRWRNLGSAADEAEVPKKRWLRPKVNSDEIKRLLVFNLNKGKFGRPPNIKLMEKFAQDEVAERKADGRMSSKGKFEYRFNTAGKIIFESASDSPILPSVPQRRRGGGESDLGEFGGGELGGGSPPKK